MRKFEPANNGPDFSVQSELFTGDAVGLWDFVNEICFCDIPPG